MHKERRHLPSFPEYAYVYAQTRDDQKELFCFLEAHKVTWESGDHLISAYTEHHNAHWNFDSNNVYCVRNGRWVSHTTIACHEKVIATGLIEPCAPEWLYIAVEEFIQNVTGVCPKVRVDVGNLL